MKELEPYVLKAFVSKLSPEDKSLYLNITTIEGENFTIEATTSGYQAVGFLHDNCHIMGQPRYETFAALLSNLSKKYTEAFANCLIDKLLVLAEDQFIDTMTNCPE